MRTMREKLRSRLNVLDANRADRLGPMGDEDVNFEQYQEMAAKGWMKDNEKEGRSMEEEHVYLFIDSAARDVQVWPSSGYFRVTLEEEVNNVIKAELIQASIPLTENNVTSSNNVIRYSFAPHAAGDVNVVTIPEGAYLGAALALEIQTQLNTHWYSALILAATHTMNYTTGFIVDNTGVREATIDQFRVQFNAFRRMMIFQITDNTDVVVTTQFALHVQLPVVAIDAGLYTSRSDDIYDVIGFNRRQYAFNGTYVAGTNTYYVTNDSWDAQFGAPSTEIDTRYAYSLHSDQSVDLRGNVAIMVDIAPFNDNDLAMVEDTGSGTQFMRNYFAIILLRPAAFVNDNSFDLCNNTYPMRRYFREGKERVKNLTVALRKPDGSLVDFGNLNYMLTLRLTVRRVQPVKSMFTR